jgi:hypothetical protein
VRGSGVRQRLSAQRIIYIYIYMYIYIIYTAAEAGQWGAGQWGAAAAPQSSAAAAGGVHCCICVLLLLILLFMCPYTTNTAICMRPHTTDTMSYNAVDAGVGLGGRHACAAHAAAAAGRLL